MAKLSLSIILITFSFTFFACSTTQPKTPTNVQTEFGTILPKEKENKKLPKKDMIFEKRKSYLPPVIPHSIDTMEINIQHNSCLNCHTNTLNDKLSGHFKGQTIKQEYKNCTMCHTKN